ncbi:condensation domain-containing protein [Streptomyces sp. NPDC020412]|uniref:condensation domain-containing protein n=1 Tax=Streptomyces sp. NPDC020412 TaxID=3365073 RepID=UPI003789B0DB
MSSPPHPAESKHGAGPERPVQLRGPLSRTQYYYWYLFNGLPPESRHRWNMTFRVPLPDGATAAEVAEAVRILVRRHDALRSTVDDTAPEPVQVVLAEAPVELTVHNVAVDDDATLDACEAELAGPDIDLRHGPTVRARLVTAAGRPAWALMVVHHLFITGRTMTTLQEEFQQVVAELLAGGPGTNGLPPVNGTAARIAYERSDRGVAVARRAGDHLAEVFRTLPNVSFPYAPREFREADGEQDADGPGTLHILRLHSPALKHAVRTAARRFKVPPCSVVFAAGDVVLSAYTGHGVAWSVAMDKGPVDPHRVQIECSIQNVFIDLGTAGDTHFSRSVQRSYRNLLLGNFYGDHDHARLVEDMADAFAARATRTTVNSWFNCVAAPVPGAEEAPSEEAPSERVVAPDALRERSRLVWDRVVDGRALVALESADLGTEIRLDLWSGKELVRRDDMPRVLRAVESLVCRLAEDGEVDLVAERAALRGDGWPREPDLTPLAPGLWVDVAATEEVLAQHPGVRHVEVAVAGDGADPGSGKRAVLTAYVKAVAPLPTSDELRRFGLGRLRTPGVVVPDRFEVVEVADSPADSPADGPTTGDGPTAAALDALCAVLERVLATGPVDPAVSFRDQGGDARGLPAAKRWLEQAGWACPTLYDDLLSPLSIGEVAARTRPTKDDAHAHAGTPR